MTKIPISLMNVPLYPSSFVSIQWAVCPGMHRNCSTNHRLGNSWNSGQHECYLFRLGGWGRRGSRKNAHTKWDTVQYHYDAINFLLNPHKRHLIARPWGMGCLLWVQTLNNVLPQFLLFFYAISCYVALHYKSTQLYWVINFNGLSWKSRSIYAV